MIEVIELENFKKKYFCYYHLFEMIIIIIYQTNFFLLKEFLTKLTFIIKKNTNENFPGEQRTHLY